MLCGCYSRSQRLYQRAEAFLAQDKPILAATEYRRLVIEDKRSPLADDALYKLAYLFREEFADPNSAIATYELLVNDYPDSPYGNEALLWVAHIQRRDLKDPEAVRATFNRMQSLYPEDERMVARCYLHLAQALYAAGRYEEATHEAQLLENGFPKERRQAAAAALIRAKALEKTSKNSGAAVAVYESILARYPESYSALEAKSALGWIYHDASKADEQKQQAALRAAARIVHGVPQPAARPARLGQLEVLRAYLAFREIPLDEQTIIALSGAAFDFFYVPSEPSVTSRMFIRNPFISVAETLGFSTNEWSAPQSEGSFTTLAQAIRHGRPVIIHQSKPNSRWCIVTGYRPAEDRITYLPPGKNGSVTTGKAAFIGAWTATRQQTYGAYYQFSIGEREQTPSEAELLNEALRMAISAGENRSISGVPSGPRAWAKLAEELDSQPSPNSNANLLVWAREQIPQLRRNRKAAAVYLRQHAKSAAGEKAGNLQHAAQVYESIDQELETLANLIEHASESAGSGAAGSGDAGSGSAATEIEQIEQWARASKQVHFIAELDAQAVVFISQAVAK